MKTPSLITALALLTSSFSFATKEGWTSDFEAAKAKAKEENKDLLIEFTGSDWCKFCVMLDREVFLTDPFKASIPGKFILVELDFPNEKSKLDEETWEQNTKLRERYQPPGFPTILLADATGKPYAMTSYLEGGAQPYVKHLQDLGQKKTKIEESLKAANELDGLEKAQALSAFLDSLPPQIGLHYQKEKNLILELDPTDTTGFKKREDRRVAKENLDAKLRTVKDPQGAIQAIDEYLDSQELDAAEKQELLVMKVDLFMSQEKLDEAEKAIDKIISVDPESNTGISAAKFKPRFVEMKKLAAAKKEKEAEKKAAEPTK